MKDDIKIPNDDRRPVFRESGPSLIKIIIIFVFVLLVGTVFFFLQSEEKAEVKQPQIEVPLPPAEKKTEEPVIHHPIPEERQENVAEAKEPLPALEDSDGVIHAEMDKLVEPAQLSEWVLFESIARRFVVITDNMSHAKLPRKYVFNKPPVGSFLVKDIGDESFLLDPDNYERYAGFVKLAESIDTDKLVKVYLNFYPLLQQVYEELGYPNAYFNDRLIEVIDHLLETPQVGQPVKLIRPKVYYQFADADLEALSAGQKLLIRMGPENATRVKLKLAELRKRLSN